MNDREALITLNRSLQSLSAQQRVEQAIEHLPGEYVLSSSFGAQAAVLLDLVSRVIPRVPVVLIDIGGLHED